MKLSTVVLILALAGVGYGFWARRAPEPVVAIATPAPIPATPAPAPTPNYFAPAGTFFLIGGASVETPDGIVGIHSGSVLTQSAPGEYTTAAGQKLSLPRDRVTNDLRVAGQLVHNDAAGQQALSAWQKSQQAAAEALRRESLAASPESVRTVFVEPERASTLERGAHSQKRVMVTPEPRVHVIEIRNR